MIRALVFLLMFISSAALAGEFLTETQKIESYARLAASPHATITDRGDFMIVQIAHGGEKSPGFYFYTKSWHPADPGIVYIQVLVENGESRMESSGKHGENEKAFKEFHEQVDRAMLQLIRGVLESTPNQAKQ